MTLKRRMLLASGGVGLALTGAGLVLAFARQTGIWDLSEHRAIRYRRSQAEDPIVRLQQRIDRGEVTLGRHPVQGYLPAVLHRLQIPTSSQTLVFSKTSFHRSLISPQSPRALYFNDHTYVGWVPRAETLEIATLDPRLGTVFYTLAQHREPPRFVRKTQECLQCHSARRTQSVPGLVLRSLFTNEQGHPARFSRNVVVSDASAWEDRWGGWYVSGSHGEMLHRGNQVGTASRRADRPDLRAGANVTDLRRFFDPGPYPAPHSDLVALLLLQHQAHLHNLMTRAGFDARVALGEVPAADRRRADFSALPEKTQARLRASTEPLVRALLFVDAAPFSARVAGTSSFAREFAAGGLRDRQGRSLRDLDLARRLLKYPCSYLIYSEQFDGLPAPVRDYVYRRLWEVLLGTDTQSEFRHLTAADRTTLREILVDTRPEFAVLQPRHALAPPSGE